MSCQGIFETVGRVVIVDEKHMDAVTGLSASGLRTSTSSLSPGEAGVKVGLPAKQHATGRADHLRRSQMVLERLSSRPPEDQVTPRRLHIDGILELEEGGLRVTLIKASCVHRARQAIGGGLNRCPCRDKARVYLSPTVYSAFA